MITTTADAPAWLPRSDQRRHLGPAPCSHRAAPSSSTARQQICQAALLATTVIRTCGIARERNCSADGKPHDSVTLSPEQNLQAKNGIRGFMHLRGKVPISVKTSNYLQRLQRQSDDPNERPSGDVSTA